MNFIQLFYFFLLLTFSTKVLSSGSEERKMSKKLSLEDQIAKDELRINKKSVKKLKKKYVFQGFFRRGKTRDSSRCCLYDKNEKKIKIFKVVNDNINKSSNLKQDRIIRRLIFNKIRLSNLNNNNPQFDFPILPCTKVQLYGISISVPDGDLGMIEDERVEELKKRLKDRVKGQDLSLNQ